MKCHIHIRKGESTAKWWLEPEIKLARSYQFRSDELKELEKQIRANEHLIKEKWNEYFNT